MSNRIFAATAGSSHVGGFHLSPRAAGQSHMTNRGFSYPPLDGEGKKELRQPLVSYAIALAAAAIAALLVTGPAAAQGTIKIGDINSFKAMSANMVPYRKGV